MFHSIPSSNRLIFDGVRRGHAINRRFEEELISVTTRALNNHSNEKGAIVVSGQSGVGKTISLYRLAERIRATKTAAVLFAKDRLPSPVELASFLAEVDRLDQVTLLIVDALEQPRRLQHAAGKRQKPRPSCRDCRKLVRVRFARPQT